jgi:hypothetical protein
LFAIGEKVVQMPTPNPLPASPDGLVRAFAIYSKAAADRVLASPALKVRVRHELFEAAHQMGAELRAELRLASPWEALLAARVLYRGLGIDLRVDPEGAVTIPTCLFSRYYSGEVCRLMSALDEGLITGLTATGTLSLGKRKTEGEACCSGTIHFIADRS